MASSATNAINMAATFSAKRKPSVAPSAAASMTLHVVLGKLRRASSDSACGVSVSGNISLAMTKPAGADITLAVIKCLAIRMRALS